MQPDLEEAMKALSEEQWHIGVDSRMGLSTSLAAIGRLMHYTGVYAGKIILFRKMDNISQNNRTKKYGLKGARRAPQFSKR